MTVRLTPQKINRLVGECNMLLEKEHASIRDVAKVIGLMMSSAPGVEYAQLFIKGLEIEKSKALVMQKGNFDAYMAITPNMKSDLLWWVDNLPHEVRYINKGNCDIEIASDASNHGWGASYSNKRTGGRWNIQEALHHINYLELLAAFFALKSFCRSFSDLHVKLLVDNTTAVAYINHMGGVRSILCNKVTKDIWLWCRNRNIWLTAAHIPGASNVEADHESRSFHDETEWKLNSQIFFKIACILGNPSIDLFASRLNTQLAVFASWRPDPDAKYIDAFTFSWHDTNFYAFPPFSLIGRCLQKATMDKAEGIIVAPIWPTQPWFAQLLRMIVATPIVLPRKDNLLQSPIKGKLHPLWRKMTLMACKISGHHWKSAEFLQRQPLLCYSLGERAQRNSTLPIQGSGYSFVVKSRRILFTQM